MDAQAEAALMAEDSVTMGGEEPVEEQGEGAPEALAVEAA